MKTLRLILAMILTLQFSWQAQAQAQAQLMPLTTDDMMIIVEDYVARMRSTQTGSIFLPVGRQEFLSKAVAARIAAEGPEQFNLLLFYLIDAYIKRPADRPYFFTLFKLLQAHIADDLEATRLLQEGPEESIKQSLYSYWVWVSIAVGISWKVILKSSAPLASRMQHVNQSLAQRGRLYHLPYRLVANPLVLSVPPVIMWGYWQYLVESHKAHKLDPLEMLKVVQANLSCHLSYRGLEIQDQIESLAGKPDELKAKAPELRKAGTELLGETKVLKEQYPLLLNLRVKDRFFAPALKQLPEAKNWQELRQMLNSTDEDQPDKCRQISLPYLESELESRLQQLPEEKSQVTPKPTGEQQLSPPQTGAP